MSQLKDKIKDLPKSAGIYQFIDETGQILYIGKAKSIQSRIRSYFLSNIGRGPAIDLMVTEASDIKYIETESEIEAVILEADLIGKIKPKYNIRLRDDKSFLMVKITKPNTHRSNDTDSMPRVELVRYKDINLQDRSAWYFGPYPSGDLLKKSLRYLRRIFPFRDCTPTKFNRHRKAGRPCLYGDLGICTGPCLDPSDKKEYLKNINYLKSFLRGKKKEVKAKLEREMKSLSAQMKFEQAAILRNRLYALDHISDVALGIKDDFTSAARLAFQRVECYDISNILGQFAVGSMVVFTNGQADKGQYRKFKIKYHVAHSTHQASGITEGESKGEKIKSLDAEYIMRDTGIGDIQMMAEVLERRFGNDWPLPDLLVIDGGVAHLNVARKVLQKNKLSIPAVSIAKGPKRDKDEFHYSDHAIASYIRQNQEVQNICLRARDEAHRFAQSYYRKLHSKGMLE